MPTTTAMSISQCREGRADGLPASFASMTSRRTSNVHPPSSQVNYDVGLDSGSTMATELSTQPTFFSSLAEVCKSKSSLNLKLITMTPKGGNRILKKTARRQEPPPPIDLSQMQYKTKILPRDIVRKNMNPSFFSDDASTPSTPSMSMSMAMLEGIAAGDSYLPSIFSLDTTMPATPDRTDSSAAFNSNCTMSDSNTSVELPRASRLTKQQLFCTFDEEADGAAFWDFKCSAGKRRRVLDAANSYRSRSLSVSTDGNSTCASTTRSRSPSVSMNCSARPVENSQKIEAWLASTKEAGIEVGVIEVDTGVEEQKVVPVGRPSKRGGIVFSAPLLPSLDFGTLNINIPDVTSGKTGEGSSTCNMTSAPSPSKLSSFPSRASFDSLSTIHAAQKRGPGPMISDRTNALIAALGLETGNSCSSLAAMAMHSSSSFVSSTSFGFRGFESTSTLQCFASPNVERTRATRTVIAPSKGMEETSISLPTSAHGQEREGRGSPQAPDTAPVIQQQEMLNTTLKLVKISVPLLVSPSLSPSLSVEVTRSVTSTRERERERREERGATAAQRKKHTHSRKSLKENVLPLNFKPKKKSDAPVPYTSTGMSILLGY